MFPHLIEKLNRYFDLNERNISIIFNKIILNKLKKTVKFYFI